MASSLGTKFAYKPFVGFSPPIGLFVVYWELDKDVRGDDRIFWIQLKEVIGIKTQAGVGVIVCHGISGQLARKSDIGMYL